MQDAEYESRVAAERQRYRDDTDVHNLPSVFEYWTNRYILPALRELGFESHLDLFQSTLHSQCVAAPHRLCRFISIGAGNCDLEIGLAQYLRSQGLTNFTLQCLDFNEDMLARGRAAANGAGLADLVVPIEGDFNAWTPDGHYDAVIANQALHHVVGLEHLFDAIRDCLNPDGCLVLSELVGRNGHLRWPEALPIVHEFWRELPPRSRYNLSLRRYEDVFEDWDCTYDGFEGIRAQDILPLLQQRLQFRFFFAFGNVIDPFVDRAFGRHLDPARIWDRDFIDRVHQRDEAEIAAGRITPTHVLAVLGKHAVDGVICRNGLTPEFCIRDPHRQVEIEPDSHSADSVQNWDPSVHDPHEQAAFLAGQIAELRKTRDQYYDEFVERTLWAQRLEEHLQQGRAQIEILTEELRQRTEWALSLDGLVDKGAHQIAKLEAELRASEQELQQLRSELAEVLRNPVHYLRLRARRNQNI